MGKIGTRIRNALVNTAILLVVSVVGLIVLEFASRIFYPLPAGTAFRDADGNFVEVFLSDTLLVPNAFFYQYSPDFNAPSSTGPLGLRTPEPKSPPELIFLGDSFTFGQGLADDQTFPAIYCRETKESCANLGYPGTGTYRQVEILEHWLGEVGWRPREVKLFVFAMASDLNAGNDLFDTATEIRAASDWDSGRGPQPISGADAAGGGVLNWLLTNRQWLRVNSNLVRILVVQFGPALRTWFSLEQSTADLGVGVEAVGSQLARLDAMSSKYNFSLSIYLLHPMQDLVRQTHRETADAVRSAAPGRVDVINTAVALLNDPAQFFFPFDGHLNPKGAGAIADFLLDHTARDRD